MLLVVDVGNTNITLGFFQEEKLLATYRMTTTIPRTSDEYGIFFKDLMAAKNIPISEIEDVIIASVVPNIMWSLTSGIIKYLEIKPMIVGVGTKTGIKIITGNPKEIGTDRIVDAVGGFDIYGGPIIVIDFGTATTYDLILEDGSFAAGITCPGIRISANALWRDTAKLPEIEIAKPKSILAKDTITSMQAGLIYGCIGQTEYIVKKIKEESGISDLKVVASGGLGKVIADSTDSIQIYDPDLTLNGLRLIYNKNKA
mgnify:CR=1 FL=1